MHVPDDFPLHAGLAAHPSTLMAPMTHQACTPKPPRHCLLLLLLHTCKVHKMAHVPGVRCMTCTPKGLSSSRRAWLIDCSQ